MKTNSIWQIIKPVRAKIILTFMVAGLGTICSIASIISLAFLVINLNKEQMPWLLIALVAIFLVLAFICRNLALTISHLAAYKLEYLLRLNLCDKFNKISLGQIQQLGTGTMSSVIDGDVNNLHGFVADSTPILPSVWLTITLLPPLLFYFDWHLALLNLVLLTLILLLSQIISKKEKQLAQQCAGTNAQIQTAIIEYIQAMPVVRTFDNSTNSFGRYQDAIDRHTEIMTRWYKSTQHYANYLRLLFNPLLILVFLLWFGAYLFIGETISTYSWVGILLLSSGLSEIIMPWFMMQATIAESNLAAQRIYQIQDLAELSEVSKTEQQLPQDNSIAFAQVDFYYDKASTKALDNISFTIKDGSRCALVGLSGAGKSTVARLIARFWDASAGTVLIGGVDIRSIPTETLMDYIAFVFQDNFLFSMSIADNIRLAKADATDEEVIQAAKLAQAHDFIMALPNGYDTQAGERGLFLSGGQKQRITIARAILQNKPILVLDEATAFADPENEAKIMQALDVLMQNKTVVIVAHRFSTIQSCQQILVFEQGKLIESGNHQQLIAQEGLYAKLWQYHQDSQNWQLKSKQTSLVAEGIS